MDYLSRSSSLGEDPLHAYSGLSLFPRTLKSLSNPLPPRLYQSDDLQQTHILLESMPFQIQKEHQEQAKAILYDSSELLKQGNVTSVTSEDMNVGVKMNPIQNKRESRPGLDRKRGQFSFKPTTSQPPSNGPIFDGSKYPKPEEHFAAYERFKNAKREWEKQTGVTVTDTHQNQLSGRPRRPGIPRRKRGSYKHTYTDSYSTDAINLETSEKEEPIPSEQSLEKTTAAHVSAANRDVDDLAVDMDKDLENILSELLACDKNELKGDGAVRLLEERLQIKPVDVGTLTIPEFQDFREMRLKASGRNPSKRKSVLSDIQIMLKGIHRDAVRKNRQSPSPMTRKHTSSSSPPVDQFSFPDIHNLLPGDQQSSDVDLAKDLNICSRSPVTNDADKDITNTSTSDVGTAYVASLFNNSVQKSSNEDNSHSGIHRSHSTPDGNADDCVNGSITNNNSVRLEVNIDKQTKGSEADVPMSKSEASRNTGRIENDADFNDGTDQLDSLAQCASREAARIYPFTVEEASISYQQDKSSKSPDRNPEHCDTMEGSFEHGEHIQEQHEEEGHNSSQEQTNKRKRGTSDKKNRSKTVPDENEEDEQMKTSLHENGANKKTKRKSNERNEEKKKQMKRVTREGEIFSRRKSLTAAGTKWESGLRRSTRIKSRPLEYWRGERFLFGRIHDSLVTVIGVKYASPEKGKTENRTSKVKSFVSDDYKDLIDLAALY